ncbi:MAG: DUF2200 domain-containing protein [Planctomycetes bacterium]|nr:DUF2200 domain-containing protein [Planctomycetota bacterium]
MKSHPVFAMPFAKVYPLYIQKAESKGRTRQEVDEVILWLTGYSPKGLAQQIEQQKDFTAFFAEAPRLNPDAKKITGTVCGVRIEDIEHPLMKKLRWLDKLVDELAKGRPMAKILRQEVPAAAPAKARPGRAAARTSTGRAASSSKKKRGKTR